MSNGPRVVCAGCGIEIPVGLPLCKECAVDVMFGVVDAPPGFCPFCSIEHTKLHGLHYNERGGYVGKCVAEVAA